MLLRRPTNILEYGDFVAAVEQMVPGFADNGQLGQWLWKMEKDSVRFEWMVGRLVDPDDARAGRVLAQVKAYDTDIECRPQGTDVHIVSTAWINKWKDSVNRGNPGLSGPRGTGPGPIDNSCLLDNCGGALQNLEIGQHYFTVNVRVWSFLHSEYGGGPEIVRKSADIYSEKVIPEKKLPDVDVHAMETPASQGEGYSAVTDSEIDRERGSRPVRPRRTHQEAANPRSVPLRPRWSVLSLARHTDYLSY